MRLLFKILLLIAVIATIVDGFKRVCYVTNWSQYRPGTGQFKPSNIDPFLCDYIIYAFAKLDENKLAPYEWNDESTSWSTGNFELLNNHKNTNPQLKTLLAVGGWKFGTQGWTAMLSSRVNRAEFINHCIDYLRQRNFDGLDLDFEYPGSRGSPAADKHHFTLLVSELRSAFDEEGRRTGRPSLLLSVAVAAGKNTIDNGYEVPKLSNYVDFFNLMAYDLNGAWDKVTGHNAPLFARSDELGTERRSLNLDWAAKYWVSLGAPKEKIMLGMATYGRGFQLANPANNGLGAPAKGSNSAGAYTREVGILSYYEICTMLQRPGTVRVYSNESQVPYAYNGDQWIGYDDKQSLQAKVDYMKKNGYGGFVVWTLDLDDFGGAFCGQGRYPLLNFLNQALKNNIPNPTTKIPARRSTAAKSPTSIPVGSTATPTNTGNGKFCESKSDGDFVNPFDCGSFYKCANGNDYIFQCPSGLKYDDVNLVCNWPTNLTPNRKAECGIS